MSRVAKDAGVEVRKLLIDNRETIKEPDGPLTGKQLLICNPNPGELWGASDGVREVGREGEREGGREAGRETGRPAGRQAGREAGREAGRQGAKEVGREASMRRLGMVLQPACYGLRSGRFKWWCVSSASDLCLANQS